MSIRCCVRHDAIGHSPFGIDQFAGPDSELATAYDVLSQVAPLILEHQSKGTMTALLLDRDGQPQTVRLRNYNIEARFSSRSLSPGAATSAPPEGVAGLFISTGPDDFVVVGRRMNVYFTSTTDPSEGVGLGTKLVRIPIHPIAWRERTPGEYVKLQFSGFTITGFVDKTRVLTATDTSLANGMAGLVTGGENNAHNTVLFDNLIINTVDGPAPKPTEFAQDASPICKP